MRAHDVNRLWAQKAARGGRRPDVDGQAPRHKYETPKLIEIEKQHGDLIALKELAA